MSRLRSSSGWPRRYEACRKEAVGMSIVDISEAKWRKSSYSSGSGGNDNCVEVAVLGQAVAVRDSKNSGGAALTYVPAPWHAFLTAAKAGHFDHR